MSRRLLALLLSAALLITGLAPTAYAAQADPETEENVWKVPELSPNAIPWDEKHPELLDPSMLYAQSAILIEASTGEVLFEKNADEIMYPASTTKIMTCYIALNMADLENDLVTISQNAIDLVPPTYATIPVSAGEEVMMQDLIAATLVRSGNEGANAIAEYLSGSVENFAALMNQTAAMLGCSQDTNFTNPSGAHDENHYTTVRDMAIIARTAMKNDLFREIVRQNTYAMPATDGVNGGHPQRTLVGGTHILDPENDYYYPDAIGVKTGFTNPAGYCFVGAAKRGGIELISVIFYSSKRGRWTDTKKLMEYGFTQVESISPESLYAEDPRVIDVTGFALDDANHGELTLGIRAVDDSKDMTIVGNSEKIDLLRDNFSEVSAIRWTREFRAPINIGDVMGILTFYSETGDTAEYELVATRSIAMRENAPPSLEQIEAYTAADENPWPRFTWDLLVPPGLILLALMWLRRFYRRHRKRRPKAPDIKPVKKRYVR
ncbi:MAG: D-alanyl-D-alanine carboxypeptidase [Clostridia bacterium]|nr:D-alanyl-D-alanine carboxypeptidase [Clostridia bacterium]